MLGRLLLSVCMWRPSVLGFIFGLLLGLVAFNVDLLYFYLSARGYYTVQLRRRRQLKVREEADEALGVGGCLVSR